MCWSAIKAICTAERLFYYPSSSALQVERNSLFPQLGTPILNTGLVGKKQDQVKVIGFITKAVLVWALTWAEYLWECVLIYYASENISTIKNQNKTNWK